MDDILGDGPWLIAQRDFAANVPGLQVVDVGSEPMRPFYVALQNWLGDRGVEAVLVRPDRYVFGSGDPAELILAWSKALSPRQRAT
jgi:3-(3-hydroxy-phenyl)propionate hydroxylase